MTLVNVLTGSAVAWKYLSLEQAIFRTVGTDMNRVSIFRCLFFGFSLMVFDMEISLSALLLFLRNGFSNILLHEVVTLTVGSIFIFLWIYLGYRAVNMQFCALELLMAVSVQRIRQKNALLAQFVSRYEQRIQL